MISHLIPHCLRVFIFLVDRYMSYGYALRLVCIINLFPVCFFQCVFPHTSLPFTCWLFFTQFAGHCEPNFFVSPSQGSTSVIVEEGRWEYSVGIPISSTLSNNLISLFIPSLVTWWSIYKAHRCTADSWTTIKRNGLLVKIGFKIGIGAYNLISLSWVNGSVVSSPSYAANSTFSNGV